MKVRSSRRSGVALLLVMGAVAILAALAVELAARANVDVMMSARLFREATFRRIHDSGTEIGMTLLTEPEAKAFDHWGERWNERFPFSLAPGETGTVRVADESGKINLAKEADPAKLEGRLRRLFEYLRERRPGRTEKWRSIEAKLLLRLGIGAPEEAPQAAPLLTLDGLREAGLTEEEVFNEHEGLHRYLTTFGDGKLNLNTAPAAVLYALDEEITQDLADRIAAYRGSADGDERAAGKPFEETKDLLLIDGVVERTIVDGVPRVARDLYAKLAGRLSVKSSAFSVRVVARVGERTRTSWAFFEPARIEQAGEKPRRSLKRLAFEEIRLW